MRGGSYVGHAIASFVITVHHKNHVGHLPTRLLSLAQVLAGVDAAMSDVRLEAEMGPQEVIQVRSFQIKITG